MLENMLSNTSYIMFYKSQSPFNFDPIYIDAHSF